MTITAKIIADSVSPAGDRLTTMQLRYPRFIHAEAKTHRVIRIDDAEYEFLQEVSFMDDEKLSRNASSSRAIPVDRMIRDVIEDPAMPVSWGSNKPGMQAGEEIRKLVECYPIENGIVHFDEQYPEDAWLLARDYAVSAAKGFAKAGYHKQIVNRLLEPFGHISVVVTATEWDNFFALRCHPDADPTMRALAEAMRAAMDASAPQELQPGWSWHLPYITEDDLRSDKIQTLMQRRANERLAMISAARCARVSYLNHDGTSPDIDKDLKLANMLLASKHMSPFEHQARLGDPDSPDYGTQYWGNFQGWDQFRKMVE